MAIAEIGISSSAAIWSAAIAASAQAGATTATGIGKKRQQKRALRAQKEAAQQTQNWNIENFERQMAAERENYQTQVETARENWQMENEYNSPAAIAARYAEAGFNYIPSSGDGMGGSISSTSMNTPSIAAAPSYDPSSIYENLNPFDEIGTGISQCVNVAQNVASSYRTLKEVDEVSMNIALKESQAAHTYETIKKLTSERMGIDLDNALKTETNPLRVQEMRAIVEDGQLTLARHKTENQMLDFQWSIQPELWKYSRKRMAQELENMQKSGKILDVQYETLKTGLQGLKHYNSTAYLDMQDKLLNSTIDYYVEQAKNVKAQTSGIALENIGKNYLYKARYQNGKHKGLTPYQRMVEGRAKETETNIRNTEKTIDVKEETGKSLKIENQYAPEHHENSIEREKIDNVTKLRNYYMPWISSINDIRDRLFSPKQLKIDVYRGARDNYASQLRKNRNFEHTPMNTGNVDMI